MDITQNVLKMCRRLPCGPEQWRDQIAERLVLIKPLLGMFTLPTLGEVKCLRRVYRSSQRLYDNEVQFSEFSLQGVFGEFEYVHPTRLPGYSRIWGLDRKGNWLLIEVTLERRRDPPEWLDLVTKVTVNESSLATLSDLFAAVPTWNPALVDVWWALGEVVEKWCQDHRRRGERLEAVATALSLETSIYKELLR